MSGQGIALWLPDVRLQGRPCFGRNASSDRMASIPIQALSNAKGTFFKVPLSFERTGDRTLDPQIKSLLLYQLSYPPDARSCIPFFGLLCNTFGKILKQI